MLLSKIHRIASRFLSSLTTYNYKIENAFDLHNLQNGPSLHSTLTKSEAKCYLRQMISIRKMENCANMLYKERLVQGFLHLYNGQVST
ncbi:hypothetical protein GJ496_011653 [Pomphorhynchus laevis]|nr:hypothetical protein GJ496_011653 [Pomphorhynchus laevis]